MTAKELYLYAIDQATSTVNQVEPEQYDLPTPDTEWDVRALMNHMLYELAWATDIVDGKTITEVGDAYEGDLVGNDGPRSWRQYELAARQSVAAAPEDRKVHLSYGDTPLNDYLFEAGNDELVHAWDLGQAIDVEVIFDEKVAKVLYERALKNQASIAGSGLYAPPVKVEATSSIQIKLLALLGRSEDWRKS
jgi:uncharacterized protein (TIGR03086 family)